MRGDTAPPSSKNPQKLNFSFAPWAAAMGLTLLRYELIDGSGGSGTQRGGRVYRAEADILAALACAPLRLGLPEIAGWQRELPFRTRRRSIPPWGGDPRLRPHASSAELDEAIHRCVPAVWHGMR